MARQTITNRSQSARQKAVLDSGFLDLLGDTNAKANTVTMEQVTGSLYYLGAKFIEIASKNLEAADKVASGALADSIIAMPLQIFGKRYILPISVASYYDFVNKGVRGWQDEKGGSSTYQFKNYGRGGGGGKSRMIDAIRQWVIKEGLKGAGRENAHPKASQRSQRRAKITDTSFKTAFIISRSVKKKGLTPTHFWDKTVTEVTGLMKEEFAAAIKIDIINSIYGTK